MISCNKKTLCENCLSEIKKEPCGLCGFRRSLAARDRSALARGTRLCGRYVLGGIIGRGGFGVTYAAYDLKADKVIAVKEFFPHSLVCRGGDGRTVKLLGEKNAGAFENGADKFLKESEQVSQFNGNPNIVNVFESFRENGTVYFAMEYIRGITLEKYVDTYGALAPEQAAYIAGRLAMALAVVHSAGLFHRDVAPDNIMLCGDGRVKLVDFGAARQFTVESTLTLTVMLKVGYTAVEQYSGSGYTGAWTDIYSVGAVMYYALTGSTPRSPYERMENDDEFSEKLSDVPEELKAVIMKACAISAKERYSTASQLKDALSALKIQEEQIPVTESFFPAWEREKNGGEKAEKHPALIPLTVCAALLAAAVIFIAVNSMTAMREIQSSLLEIKAAPAESTGAARALNGTETEPAEQTETSPEKNVPENAAKTAEPVTIDYDGEYKGFLEFAGEIPYSVLERFGGDVQITLSLSPYGDEPDDWRYAVIPADSAGRPAAEYISSPDDGMWTDSTGYIYVGRDGKTLEFILSREGIEALDGKSLGFLAANEIIVSAKISRGEKRKKLNLNDYSFNGNAAAYEVVNEDGKTRVISEPRVMTHNEDNGLSVTQFVPESAFLVFDGDIRVTLDIEHDPYSEKEEQFFFVCCCGIWIDIFRSGIIVPEVWDSDGNQLVKVHNFNGNYAVSPDSSLSKCAFVIKKEDLPKMAGGLYFSTDSMNILKVRLENYEL